MLEKLEEMVDNIREPSAWVRVLFVVAFALALNFIILPIVIVLSIAQALFSILSGDSNANLRYFAATLGLYISQIVKYLTYNSEEKPFPFSGFPNVDGESTEKAKTPNTGKSRTGTGNSNNVAKNANDVNDTNSGNAATESTAVAKGKPSTKKAANKKNPVKKPDANKEASEKSSGSDMAES